MFLSQEQKTSTRKIFFWNSENQIKKLNFELAIARVAKTKKDNLIFDPIGFDEWSFLSSTDKNELKKLIYEAYIPKTQIVLSMPK